MHSAAQSVSIPIGPERRVSGLLLRPSAARAGYVLAHGAGAGMAHPFLEGVATGLAERGIATLRYQFPYMEAGARRPDPPRLAEATVRAAVAHAAGLLAGLPLLAGGKSFGGRMTSQAQSSEPMADLHGIAFLGFPLHPAGRPAVDRAAHLEQVQLPLLFLQGTRDALAEAGLMEQVARRLGARATLTFFADADHSFHVPARSGRTDAEIRGDMLDAFARWADAAISGAKQG